jgi:hypothetical protein
MRIMAIRFQKKAFRLKKKTVRKLHRTVTLQKMKNIICKPMKKNPLLGRPHGLA